MKVKTIIRKILFFDFPLFESAGLFDFCCFLLKQNFEICPTQPQKKTYDISISRCIRYLVAAVVLCTLMFPSKISAVTVIAATAVRLPLI